jgi:hypothetical protein
MGYEQTKEQKPKDLHHHHKEQTKDLNKLKKKKHYAKETTRIGKQDLAEKNMGGNDRWCCSLRSLYGFSLSNAHQK